MTIYTALHITYSVTLATYYYYSIHTIFGYTFIPDGHFDDRDQSSD